MALPKRQFQGTLDGENVRTLQKKVDYGIIDLNGRLNKVEEILGCSEFFIEYLSNYYTGIANTSTPLSEDNNVFQLLERLITYIMNSQEIKDEISRNEIQYIFYKDREYFEKVLAKEVKFEGILDPSNESGEVFLHYFMSNDDKNYKESIFVDVDEKDVVENSYMGEVLREYQKLLNTIDDKLKNGSDIPRYYLTRNKRSVKNDMVDVKVSQQGLFKGKHVGNDSCDYNLLGQIDLTDPWHVQQTLRFPVGNLRPDSDLDVLVHDLQKGVNKTKISKRWKDILKLYRKGMTTYEIADCLNIGQSSVVRAIHFMSKRIAKTMTEIGGY